MKPYNNPITVPWFDSEEFRTIRKLLFSDSLVDKRLGVEKILIWDTRIPALPAGVEATALLIRAVIQDCLYEGEKNFCLELDVQSMYSMALIRTVNLVLEVGNEGRVKTSLAKLAKQFGVPELLVDLRHDMTHSHIPPLSVLRVAANIALKYLEETYWHPETEIVKPLTAVKDPYEEALTLELCDFRSFQLRVLQTRNRRRSRSVADTTIQAVNNFQLYITKDYQLFLNVLAQPKVFVNASDLRSLYGIAGITDDECLLVLPDVVVEFWQPIIQLLHNNGLIPKFLEMLLTSLEYCYIPVCQKTAVAWAMEILNYKAESANPGLHTLFYAKKINFNYLRLLHACLCSATQYSLDLFNTIVLRVEDEVFRYQNAGKMMLMKSGMLTESKELIKKPLEKQPESMSSDLYFTFQDAVDDTLDEKKKKRKSRRKEDFFRPCASGVHFPELPLGAILNPNVKNPSLKQEIKEEEVGSSPLNERNRDDPYESAATSHDIDMEFEEFPVHVNMLYRRR